MSLESFEIQAVCSETNISIFSSFDCGNQDLNDFFLNDCLKYKDALLGKTYCFVDVCGEKEEVVCAFTVSNDSIRMEDINKKNRNRINRSIPNSKRMNHYPAVLIGRLGVNVKYAKQGIGTELMNFIKAWFIDEENKTGCRYIAVDAYNDERALSYYLKNDFLHLFNNEEEEKETLGLDQTVELRTRFMLYDLALLNAHNN